jgi:hypothetical protein
MRWIWPGVVALALLAASCGGGNNASPALSAGDLREMALLTSAGLPWQITPQEDSAKSDEQAAGDFLDATTWLDNYHRWGRSGGHTATFSVAGNDTIVVETQVESYESGDGATDAFTALRNFMASPDAVNTYQAQGFSGIHVDETKRTTPSSFCSGAAPS